MTIGTRVKLIERVVAIPPEHLHKFKMAGDVVEEIPPDKDPDES